MLTLELTGMLTLELTLEMPMLEPLLRVLEFAKPQRLLGRLVTRDEVISTRDYSSLK